MLHQEYDAFVSVLDENSEEEGIVSHVRQYDESGLVCQYLVYDG